MQVTTIPDLRVLRMPTPCLNRTHLKQTDRQAESFLFKRMLKHLFQGNPVGIS